MMILELLKELLFFAGYITGKNGFPKPLTRHEEGELLKAMEQGDGEARQKLIEHNLRLVAHIAHKYNQSGQDEDDLTSIGTIGLIKAVNTFKPGKGSQLSTYAARCIENEILMTLRAEKKRRGDVSIQEPIGTDKDGNDVKLLDTLGTEADELENAAMLSMDTEVINRLMAKLLTQREQKVIRMRYGLDSRPLAVR